MSKEYEGGKVLDFPDSVKWQSPGACNATAACPLLTEVAANATVSIYPCGWVSTKVEGIQPEYVPSIIRALDDLKLRLEDFAGEAAASTTAKVARIKRTSPFVVAAKLAPLAPLGSAPYLAEVLSLLTRLY